MEKVLVLDNYDSFTYNLVHYIEALNYEVDVFRNDEISLEAVGVYDIIILSPGPGLPKDAGILLDVIKTYAPTKKILGVCLGMQAIGEVFGGKLENLSHVFHGVASQLNVIDTTDKLFENLPQQFEIGRYHSWVVSQNNFPSELKITAVEENKQIMALRHVSYNLYGVQFHPESVMTPEGPKIIRNWIDH